MKFLKTFQPVWKLPIIRWGVSVLPLSFFSSILWLQHLNSLVSVKCALLIKCSCLSGWVSFGLVSTPPSVPYRHDQILTVSEPRQDKLHQRLAPDPADDRSPEQPRARHRVPPQDGGQTRGQGLERGLSSHLGCICGACWSCSGSYKSSLVSHILTHSSEMKATHNLELVSSKWIHFYIIVNNISLKIVNLGCIKGVYSISVYIGGGTGVECSPKVMEVRVLFLL